MTESTACLLVSRDQHSRDHGGASDDVTRLEYSMAIVRMVNGISDKAQKGKTAVSVSSNAAAAGKFVVASPQGFNDASPSSQHTTDSSLQPLTLHVNVPLILTFCSANQVLQCKPHIDQSACLQTALAGTTPA